MESTEIENRRKSQRVPVELTILGELDGQRIAMRSSNISRDGMFLYSKAFVPPHAVFGAWVWLDADEGPLKVYLTSCFIESTRAGFALGVQISGMASDDAKRWESFYHGCVEAHLEQAQSAGKPVATVANRHLLVVGSSLHPLAIEACAIKACRYPVRLLLSMRSRSSGARRSTLSSAICAPRAWMAWRCVRTSRSTSLLPGLCC